MKPLLELPIIIRNNDESAVREVIASIRPEDIEYYYPDFHRYTIIVMKSASRLMTPLDDVELGNVLKEYNAEQKKKKWQFELLSITFKKN